MDNQESDDIKKLFQDLPKRLDAETQYESKTSGFMTGNKVIIDLEFDGELTQPSYDYDYDPKTDFHKVKCYFCKKERVLKGDRYVNSSWVRTCFKNSEVSVMSCSPFCYLLLNSEREYLMARDIIRYRSPYVGKYNLYEGEYSFKTEPIHELEFLGNGKVWSKCFFCGKESLTEEAKYINSEWSNLYFKTDEAVVVCSQNCIPSKFSK